MVRRRVLTILSSSGDLGTELRVVVLMGDRVMEVGSLSSGELQRIELATRLAISQLTPMVGQVLIWDEVTTGIDDDGYAHLVNLINRLECQIIAVSHKEMLVPAFDTIFRLQKVDGATVVC